MNVWLCQQTAGQDTVYSLILPPVEETLSHLSFDMTNMADLQNSKQTVMSSLVLNILDFVLQFPDKDCFLK